MNDMINPNQQLCLVCGTSCDNISSDNLCKPCRVYAFPFNQLENEDFYSCLNINDNLDINTNINELDNMIFNPFDLNLVDNALLADIDPDLNFSWSNAESSFDCKCYTEDAFNDKIAKDKNSNKFSLIHLNIRSAQKNLFNFDAYLQNINNKFDVIGISETWLNEFTVERYTLDRYKHEYKLRKAKRGGGVSLFVGGHITYKVRENFRCHGQLYRVHIY